MTTERFDIETFEKNKDEANDYEFTLEDGTQIRQSGGSVDYLEFITPPPPNLFITVKNYYKSGSLKGYVIRYPNNFMKLRKEYDEDGRLTEYINYDTPFKFTFEQLLELLKKQEDPIDLKDRFTEIYRLAEGDKVTWTVEYTRYKTGSDGHSELIIMTIDGITGEILKRDCRKFIED